MKYAQSSQSGFSLVETLVAVTILLLVIIGPLTISTSTARSTSFASEQVVAFFLAQEGVELVQKARDDLLLSNFSTPQNGWDAFSDDSTGALYEDCFGSNGCGLQFSSGSAIGALDSVVDCTGTSCLLNLDTNGDRVRYTHDSLGNVPTLYTRVIKLSKPSVNSDEVKVVSQVTWRTGSQRKSQEVEVDTYLYNVYGN